jgi:hypothetical protein
MEAEASKIDLEIAERGIVQPNDVIADALNDVSLYK